MERTGRLAAFDPTTSTDEPFYERVAPDRYRAGRFTMSPWDDALQHGSPPTALLVAALGANHPSPEMRIARVTAEFLGPIPRAEMQVRTRIARPGRRIELLEGELLAGDRAVLAARAWRIATQPPQTVPPGATPPDPVAPLPGIAAVERDAPHFDYAESIEWRYVRSARGELGPAAVWMRVRAPLIGGVALEPLDRLLLIADSANGICPELPFARWSAVPMSLSLAFERYPEGAWVLLDARTSLAGDGLGVTSARYADARGYLGTGTQPLLVAAR